MYCRHCGKSINDDSTFCSYCGKSVIESNTSTHSQKQQPSVAKPISTQHLYSTIPHREKASNREINYSLLRKICLYTTLVAFIVLFGKMSPGFGTVRVIIYLIGILLATILVYFYNKKANETASKSFQLTGIIVSCIILCTLIGLRICYEAKKEMAFADQNPPNNLVHLKLSIEDDYYSSKEGYAYNAKTRIRFENEIYSSGDIIDVKIDKNYEVTVLSGYSYSSDSSGKGNGGNTSFTMNFTGKNVLSGYSKQIKVPFRSKTDYSNFSMYGNSIVEYAIVKLKLTRCLDFWEVLFY